MKKLIYIFFTLIIFTNISYASFPITDNLKLKQDTLQTEEIKQYHSNLIKMGIDLNDCRCESCRKGNKFLKNNTMQQSGATGLYILSGLLFLGVVVWSFIGLTRAYNCVDSRSDCPQSTGGKPKNGAPIEFLWISIILLISIGIAIKARFIQLRTKRNILKNN